MESEEVANVLLDTIYEGRHLHSCDTSFYKLMTFFCNMWVKERFCPHGLNSISFQSIGEVFLPYIEQGNINTSHLFGLDELIIFSFYRANKEKYSRVADFGANIGLHSIILSKLGYQVSSYEPDPDTFAILNSNLKLNKIEGSVDVHNSAVSTLDGKVNFTRVLGNRTGSHISGAKNIVYGDTQVFEVKTESFSKLMRNFDLIKMDIEGHEASVLTSASADDWSDIDLIAEVSSEDNAKLILDYCAKVNLNIFSQKNNWNKVESLSLMPTRHQEGSIFITQNEAMDWGASQ